jgi:ATP-dependent Zn protease
MKRRHKRTIATAYHEAGHAVIGRVLTLKCGEATIKPNYRTRTAGLSTPLR